MTAEEFAGLKMLLPIAVYFAVLLVAAAGVVPLLYGAVGRPRARRARLHRAAARGRHPDPRPARHDRRALPAVLDLLTLSVEAGMSFDAALQRVNRRLHGPLIDELTLLQRDMQLGTSPARRCRALATRVEAPEVTSFVRALSQSDKLGVPLAQMLRQQADDLRTGCAPRPRSGRCGRRSRCCSRPCC